MKYLGLLVCCVSLVGSSEVMARSRGYKACIEKPQFEKPVFIRQPVKAVIEQPVIGKPKFDKPVFDRLKREGAKYDRFIYEPFKYERAVFDNQCDLKKLNSPAKQKKERFVPMEKQFRFSDVPQFAAAPQKATDCPCTAAVTSQRPPVN